MKTTIRYSREASGVCRGCALAACGLAVGTLSGSVFADWQATPDIRMEIEANDNPRLGQNPGELDGDELDDHTATRMLMDARVRLRNVGRAARSGSSRGCAPTRTPTPRTTISSAKTST